MNRHVVLANMSLATGAFACLHRHDLGTLLLAARAAMAGDLARRGQRLDIPPQGGACPVTGPTRALAALVMEAIRMVSEASRRGATLTAEVIADETDLVLVVAGERRWFDRRAIHAGFGEATGAMTGMALPGCETELMEDETGPLAIIRFGAMPWAPSPDRG